VSHQQEIVIWCAFSFHLVIGCAHTNQPMYLSSTKIQELIIGNSLKEAGSGAWQEDYLRSNGDILEGNIRGRSKVRLPYAGTWSIVGDLMCVKYPTIPDQGGCYRFSRRNGNKILWFDEAGALIDESELIEREEAEDVAAELAPPAFRQETVTFQHGQDSLVGDLSLPASDAPHPAVVFVHGSGPAPRHMQFLELIRDEFLRRGFATLIWSKPGVDESTGDYLKQTMAMRAEEVAAAMMYLAERADIDADRIGLWGISQAGWVMPMVPLYRKVAFVISVSGSAQTGQAQDLYDDDLADALEHRRKFYELIRGNAGYAAFLPRYQAWLEEMKSRPWYPALESQLDGLIFQDSVLSMGPREYEFFFINDVNGSLVAPPQLKNLSMPVLAIYGTADALVDSESGSDAYGQIPRINGNPDVTVELFEGADHGIMQPDSEGYLDFAPGFLSTMGEWLAQHR
jgi:pimeloyl-ACP methyl ester carboxylesterase